MNRELPLSLYKANTELQLQFTRLLQQASHDWLEAAQQLSAEGIQETAAQIHGLLNTADWQAATALPAEVFWRVLEGRLRDVQSINRVAMKSQAAFADGVREALGHWQEAVSAAFGVDPDDAAFARLYQQWIQPWAASEARGSKSRK